MKKLSTLIATLSVVCMASSAFASESVLFKSIRDAAFLNFVTAQDLINWKIGDEADYTMHVVMFGSPSDGTMVMSVTKEEGAAVWVKQAMDLQTQQDVVEELMNRADGKILKYLHNGQEEAIPTDKPTIISTNYESITVPAGTFKALHIVAKTQQIDKLEMWANPTDVVMSGMIKTLAPTQMAEITLELTSMKHGQ